MTSMKRFAAGLLLAVALLGGSIASRAQNESELLAGTTAQWWQYAVSTPASVSPFNYTTDNDPKGLGCRVGQHDPIWFLVGAFFGGTANRTCTVPAGEWLFFPVINNFWTNTADICGQTGNLNVTQERSLIAPLIDSATNMSVTVDGKIVPNLIRIKSVPFATAMPVDNIFNDPCGGPGTVPARVYSPSVDDGYYVLLKPLKVGTHTLQIHAESSDGFTVVVNYTLIIAPAHLN